MCSSQKSEKYMQPLLYVMALIAHSLLALEVWHPLLPTWCPRTTHAETATTTLELIAKCQT